MKMMMMIKFLQIYTHMFMIILSFLIFFIATSLKKIHPLMLGIIMLIYSIMISYNMNMYNKSSIYSLMMFLIIIGGFLILFLYFNSFAINKKMIFNKNMLYLFLYKMFLFNLLIIIIFMKNNFFNLLLFLNNKLMEMMNFMMLYNNNNNNNINLLYMKYKNLTLFLIIYLLYSLIIIVKIIFFIKPKSIRQLMN